MLTLLLALSGVEGLLLTQQQSEGEQHGGHFTTTRARRLYSAGVRPVDFLKIELK